MVFSWKPFVFTFALLFAATACSARMYPCPPSRKWIYFYTNYRYACEMYVFTHIFIVAQQSPLSNKLFFSRWALPLQHKLRLAEFAAPSVPAKGEGHQQGHQDRWRRASGQKRVPLASPCGRYVPPQVHTYFSLYSWKQKHMARVFFK